MYVNEARRDNYVTILMHCLLCWM